MRRTINKKSAVVLLSGGLDSTTTLAYAIDKGFKCYALTFVYGQRHKLEIEHSKTVAKYYRLGRRHKIIRLDKKLFLGSALTDKENIPENRNLCEISKDIPPTYVPARNTVFLSMALAYAEQTESCDIFIGANAIDFSGYPDCRPEYINAFEKLANLGTKLGAEGKKITIHSPLINLSKPEIIRLGLKLGVDYSITWSCYNPQNGNLACGKCDSCILRRNAFKEVGIEDPIKYVC